MTLPFKTSALFMFFAAPIFVFSSVPPAHAGTEGMASMPKIVEKKTRTVETDDAVDSEKGFGAEAPMVRMMNLMMVEGSGMEGMKMGNMKGSNSESSKNSSMEGMNMTLASAGETAPTSQSATQANAASQSEYLVEAKSSVSPPKAGLTVINVKVSDKATKKAISGIKLKAQVYMTSMDMGTEEPEVTDSGSGTYKLKAPFAMKGPWALKIIFPNNKVQVFNFDVQAAK
jgi:hypothetical protein